MRRLMLISTLLFLAAVSLGSAKPNRGEVMVSAASSLSDAFTEIAAEYQKKHPGAEIKLNFASSGTLATQIEQGAPTDVFVSADPQQVDRLIGKNLMVPSTNKAFASNRLVVVLPQNSELRIRSLSDLKSKDIRYIGIGDPSHVPNGKYAREALERTHLWRTVIGKLVMGSDVRQVRTYAMRGEVDAAFVFASDVRGSRLRVDYIVPEALHDRILYCAAVTKTCSDLAAAKGFIAFLQSRDGQRISRKYGFAPVGK